MTSSVTPVLANTDRKHASIPASSFRAGIITEIEGMIPSVASGGGLKSRILLKYKAQGSKANPKETKDRKKMAVMIVAQ
jgi:hypothetical protein